MDFSDFMIFIQDIPTETWQEEEISTVLSEAYVLQYTYEDAIGHMVTNHQSSSPEKTKL
jgi:hypothetical protein